MSDAHDKLLEAKFFRQRMEEAQSERYAFKYYLSAFLSAARSVTLIMQKEFGNAPGFKEWYENKQAGMKKDIAMTFLNGARRMSIHEKPVQPFARVDVTIFPPPAIAIASANTPTIIITKANGTMEKSEPDPTQKREQCEAHETTEKGSSIVNWRWYFDELPDRDVVTFCEEQGAKLDALVAECEYRFCS